MANPAQATRQTAYQMLSRMAGIVLILCCVLFQRRGLLHWTELVFLGLCVGLQETFLRLPSLRRLRTAMLVVYAILPLGLAVMRAGAIMPYRGDFVQLALNTPLPLVLVSVQIMVLYVREAQRMSSVVMVLALFSAVIGVRRPLDDIKWPWIAAVGILSAIYLVLSHPGAVFLKTLARTPARSALAQPASRPGSILRGPFMVRVPLLASAVLLAAAVLYLGMPRPNFETPPQPNSPLGQGPLGGPPGQGGGGNQGGGQGRPGNTRPDQSVSGLAGGVNLGDFGEIKLQKLPALEVRPLGRTGLARTSLYLRAYTFSEFDGQRWSNAPAAIGETHLLNEPASPGEVRDLLGAPIQFGAAWADRRWAVKYLAAGIGKNGELAMPPEALRVSGLGGSFIYDQRANILRAPGLKAGDELQVESRELVALHSQLATALAGSRPVLPPNGERYVKLPPGLKQKVVAVFGRYGDLEKALTTRPRDPRRPADERTGAFACAVRIVDTFHKAKAAGGAEPAWRYSLEFRPGPGPDAIVHFLDTRASPTAERYGHCEYFASGMVVLLRCLGIPCRMCAGFVAGKPDDKGVHVVDTSTAHAWVEVWFEDYGWVAFDPTPPEGSTAAPAQPDQPAQPEPEPAPPTTANDPATEPEQPAGGDWVSNFGRDDQQQAMDRIGSVLDSMAKSIGEFIDRVTAWMPSVLPRHPALRAAVLLGPLLAAGAVALALRRKRARLKRQVLAEMGDSATPRQRGLYLQLLLTAARYGFHKLPSETPAEFAERVIRKGGERHLALRRLTWLFYELRYGGKAAAAEAFTRGMDDYARLLRRDHEPAPAPQ